MQSLPSRFNLWACTAVAVVASVAVYYKYYAASTTDSNKPPDSSDDATTTAAAVTETTKTTTTTTASIKTRDFVVGNNRESSYCSSCNTDTSQEGILGSTTNSHDNTSANSRRCRSGHYQGRATDYFHAHQFATLARSSTGPQTV